jgi:hypothetical protein
MAIVSASSASRVLLRTIAATLILALSFLFLAAGPAGADCDVLDPTCVIETVDDTTDPVTDTVDEVVTTVEETVDEVVTTVEETVDDVVETVEETVGPVADSVDDPIATVEDTIDPIAPGVSDPPTEDPRPGTDPSVVRPDPQGGPLVESGLLGGSGPLGPAGFVGFVGEAVPPSPQGLLGPLVGAPADLVKRLAFPLALIALVFAFVTVQNRLDRKDPKLALAAATPDVLNFA